MLLAGFVTTLDFFSLASRSPSAPFLFLDVGAVFSTGRGVRCPRFVAIFHYVGVELIPVYLLVCIWGWQRRRYAATKFLLYTAAASIFILVAALAMGLYGGGDMTFDITALASKEYPLGLQLLLYAGLLIAFGVKLAVFPLIPGCLMPHGEASSPVSMILAGVLLKMGGYGLIRLNLELLPTSIQLCARSSHSRCCQHYLWCIKLLCSDEY